MSLSHCRKNGAGAPRPVLSSRARAFPMLHSITLTLKRDHFLLLHPLLQNGFCIQAGACSSLRDILISDLGLPQETVRRIRTVLLDGIVVHDLDAVYPPALSTLALLNGIAVMPGTGTYLDRTFFGSRSAISSGKCPPTLGDGIKEVRIQLCSLLAEEWGDILLERGIIVATSDMKALLEEPFPDLRGSLREARLNETGVTASKLSDWIKSRPDWERIGLCLLEP